MDAALHHERFASSKKLHPLPMKIEKLPDGAMVQNGDDSFLIVQGRALLWSPAGYTKSDLALNDAMLLSPPSTLRAFMAGYRPLLHPSAHCVPSPLVGSRRA